MNLEEEIDQLKVQASVDRATIEELNACLQQEREGIFFFFLSILNRDGPNTPRLGSHQNSQTSQKFGPGPPLKSMGPKSKVPNLKAIIKVIGHKKGMVARVLPCETFINVKNVF